jgi:lysophospholipase L1-like esterase
MLSPRWRRFLGRWLARGALVIGSVSLVLLIGEAIARVTWREPPPAIRLPPSWDQPVPPDLPVLKHIPELSQKNVRGINNGVFFRTNSAGLRGPEYDPEPARGVFRIAITGDSVTMGSGVDESDAYPMQLERLLNAEESHVRYEVLNVGLSGINTKLAIRRLAAIMGAYHPHLLVYGFTLNDIKSRRYEHFKDRLRVRDFWRQAAEARDSPSYLWRRLWPRLVGVGARIWSGMGPCGPELQHNYFENPAAWKQIVRGLRHYRNMARRRGMCAHVLIHTYLSRLDGRHRCLRIYDHVEQEAQRQGLTVTQTFPYFEGLDASELWLDVYDPHPNPEGHAILARALRDGLRELSTYCWEPQAGRRFR